MKSIALALVILAAGIAPALANPNCLGRGGTLALDDHGRPSESVQAEIDLRHLRSRGIRASTAERTWLECIKITRLQDGRWSTEYYDPSSFQQIY